MTLLISDINSYICGQILKVETAIVGVVHFIVTNQNNVIYISTVKINKIKHLYSRRVLINKLHIGRAKYFFNGDNNVKTV